MTPYEEFQERKIAALEALRQVYEVYEAALVLVDSVEKYVRQETSRSTLIWKKEYLKRLLEK